VTRLQKRLRRTELLANRSPSSLDAVRSVDLDKIANWANRVGQDEMRLTTVVSLCIVGAMLLLPSPIQAQTDDSQLPVSMERIRAALKQPPPLLQVPAPSGNIPTFRIEVRERLLVPPPIDEKPFDPTFGLPSAGELLMNGIEKIRLSAVHYKRGRAERRARKEVEDALAAFCAVRECPTLNTASHTPKTGS
jgi:hypothetical protein